MTETGSLEAHCAQCDGTGTLGEEVTHECWMCEGTGYVLTEAGRRITDFMGRIEQRLRYRRSAA